MNRIEALRLLGLDEDATDQDIKIAYKETVQILHPDRFASNKKLQERATEQFKNLQEAYEYLTSSAARKSRRGGTSSMDDDPASRRASARYQHQQAEARLAGIQAARTQLVKQRDALLDERRNALIMMVVGGIVAFIAIRRPGAFKTIGGIASAAAIWGVVSLLSSQRNINTLNDHIAELRAEEKAILDELDGAE